MEAWKEHWPEYVIEAGCLATFMISATGFAILLQHPRSPLAAWMATGVARRLPMALAMGATAAALIYSPFGQRSGAHMNPAVTLTFLRLRKIAGADAFAYIVAQFVGAVAGTGVALPLFGHLSADPSINFIVTVPGPAGPLTAFAAEAAMSCALMLVVLAVSSSRRFAPFTGAAAAVMVAGFVCLEAPLSGMSMNPARTLGPALFTVSPGLWIYFVAPPLGMLAAAELFQRAGARARVLCAKLHHGHGRPCIFHCAEMERAA